MRVEKNSTNPIDIHLNDQGDLGSTVKNQELYASFCSRLVEAMKEKDFGFSVQYPSKRYPFRVSKDRPILTKNTAYWVHEKNTNCDCFAMRPASQLVNGSKSLMVAFRIALLISEMLSDGKGMSEKDKNDFATLGFGYKDFEDKETGQKDYGYNDSYEFIESIDKLVPPKDLDD